jgi:hypothetical protein
MSSVVKRIFDVDVACDLDVNCAIILSNIQYWVFKNATNRKHLYDGRYWSYNSASAYSEQFKWLSERQIRTCLNKLMEHHYILDANYNANNWDRTKWYGLTEKSAVNDLTICIDTDMSNASDQYVKCNLPNGDIDVTDRSHRSDQMVTSYKEHIIITDNKPYVSDTQIFSLKNIEVNNPVEVKSQDALPDLASKYMVLNCPTLWESAWMKAPKHVNSQKTKVIDHFDAAVLKEGIEYDGKKLYGRLLGLINNWKPSSDVTTEKQTSRKLMQ